LPLFWPLCCHSNSAIYWLSVNFSGLFTISILFLLAKGPTRCTYSWATRNFVIDHRIIFISYFSITSLIPPISSIINIMMLCTSAPYSNSPPTLYTFSPPLCTTSTYYFPPLTPRLLALIFLFLNLCPAGLLQSAPSCHLYNTFSIIVENIISCLTFPLPFYLPMLTVKLATPRWLVCTRLLFFRIILVLLYYWIDSFLLCSSGSILSATDSEFSVVHFYLFLCWLFKILFHIPHGWLGLLPSATWNSFHIFLPWYLSRCFLPASLKFYY